MDIFEFEDSRYLYNNLEELLNTGRIEKVLYRRFNFYVLTDNKGEVRRKVRLIKKYIKKTLDDFGPLKAKQLVKKIQIMYNYNVSILMVYRLSKELLEDNEIKSVKLALSNIYYSKNNPKQEKEAKKIIEAYRNKKRLKKLKRLIDKYIEEINKEFGITYSQKKYLYNLFNKIKPLLSIDCAGISYEDLIFVTFFLQIKKEIFIKLREDESFEEIKTILSLYELFLEIKIKDFSGYSRKSYISLLKDILRKKEFCEPESRKIILNTPSFSLRINYLISLFNFDKNIQKEILKFIKRCNSNGFRIGGKKVKGILGGAVYLYCKKTENNITQQEVAETLGITEVTIRNRVKELKNHI
jgi:hypothetical protein